MRSQKQKIFNHLRATGPLTKRYAANEYNIWRLEARICELRQEGHDIRTDMVPNANGGKHARYTLVKEAR